MRKSILLAMLLLLSVSSANAALAPLNVQQAAINTENPDQLTIGFDWFHDHGSSAGSETSSDGFNLLRMDWRHSLDTGIPTRIGMSAGLSYGTTDSTTGDSSAFGFSNIGLSLEAALVDEEDKYNAFDLQGERFTTVLFPPVKGGLSSGFDYESKHYGVDIAMPENSPVHSISEGIVVFAEWTSETGFVIILEHLNGLTSIYKHNSSIIKTQGDRIETGEIIAFTGNTGSLTTGPHLHFELWYQGEPVDPESYIEF